MLPHDVEMLDVENNKIITYLLEGKVYAYSLSQVRGIVKNRER